MSSCLGACLSISWTEYLSRSDGDPKQHHTAPAQGRADWGGGRHSSGKGIAACQKRTMIGSKWLHSCAAHHNNTKSKRVLGGRTSEESTQNEPIRRRCDDTAGIQQDGKAT